MIKYILLALILFSPLSLLAQDTSQTGEEVYQVVEKSPRPVYGITEMYSLMADEMQYPEDAKAKGIEGRVFVQFIVEKDGSLNEFKVLKSPGHPEMDEEAIRLFQLSSPWLPGMQNGKEVRVRMILPITFDLND